MHACNDIHGLVHALACCISLEIHDFKGKYMMHGGTVSFTEACSLYGSADQKNRREGTACAIQAQSYAYY